MNGCIIDTANQDVGIDRISYLPRDIIDNILYRLPTLYAVRTSVLSREWKYKWVSVLQLDFGVDFFKKCKHLGHGEAEIPCIISRILLLHKGPIHRFRFISLPFNYPLRIPFTCLNEWLLLLSRNGLKHLDLHNRESDRNKLPLYFFSCKALTTCHLAKYEMSLPLTYSGFQNLTKIRFSSIKLEPGALETFISGCPKLLVLYIFYCSGMECINVTSPSLKTLVIHECRTVKSICFRKATGLTCLEIMHLGPPQNFEKTSLSDFIEGLQNILMISLKKGYIKILSAGSIPETLPRSIDTLKYLHLHGLDFNEPRELLFTICILKSSPNLRGLIMSSESMAVEGLVPIHLKELDNCNNCFLSHLEFAEILVKTAYKPALDLIQFILSNSPSLKTLTFKIDLGLDQSSYKPLQSSISQELSQMQRASPKVEVELLLYFSYKGLFTSYKYSRCGGCFLISACCDQRLKYRSETFYTFNV